MENYKLKFEQIGKNTQQYKSAIINEYVNQLFFDSYTT